MTSIARWNGIRRARPEGFATTSLLVSHRSIFVRRYTILWCQLLISLEMRRWPCVIFVGIHVSRFCALSFRCQVSHLVSTNRIVKGPLPLAGVRC